MRQEFGNTLGTADRGLSVHGSDGTVQEPILGVWAGCVSSL
jgi:hypothetical protein